MEDKDVSYSPQSLLMNNPDTDFSAAVKIGEYKVPDG